jgi:hypothetical protein
MSFQEWLTSVQLEMVKHISTKNISLLCDLDKRIQIVKEGKFSYWKCQDTKYESDLHSTSVYRYLNELEEDKIYTFIPFISVNNRPDEPYIILSQQILVTRKSLRKNIDHHQTSSKNNFYFQLKIWLHPIFPLHFSMFIKLYK